MMHASKPKKPPACDACKARRVLCHPQPNGAPCPRCAEKGVVCTTTRAFRGRPREIPVFTKSPESLASRAPASSSSSMILRSTHATKMINECLDLTPSLVAHFFQCFDRIPQSMNPIINITSIRTTIRAVSYQLHLLPLQTRVLALCIIALSSLISFNEAMLGDGPRPESFSDPNFFSSRRDVLRCGPRRSVACRALHVEALKAAWDSGVILQVSNENAAVCFLLDLLEQFDSCGPSRPWAAAYISHLRALGPAWRASAPVAPDGNHWGLMFEALRATGSRKPILFTRSDQLLLSGPEPPPPETLLATLEASPRNSGIAPLFQSTRPYAFHVTCLARQLWETVTGDHARLNPVSEVAVIQLLASLSVVHAVLTRLLERADAALHTSGPTNQSFFPLTDTDAGGHVRHSAAGISLGFALIVLPLHRELEYREQTSLADTSSYPHSHARMRLLRAQAHEMAVLGAHEFARAIRYLPPIHYAQIPWATLRDYAQFALDEADGGPAVSYEQMQDLETIAGELVLSGYSLDLFSSPQNASLVDRLVAHTSKAGQASEFFDPGGILADMFLPLDQGLLDPAFEPQTQCLG
ncbi:hypothetical protein FB451DRAFT_1265219 [Mycena latifolia]|nr:hypothetical protein FB451DRAFT_1265219 [Mycena latifolia]